MLSSRPATVVLLLLGPLVLLLGLASAVAAAESAAEPTVVVHRLPRDVLVPEVKVAADGTVHMVYGTSEKEAFYQQSTDGGATFSSPLKLSTTVKVCTTMGERGPKLAVGGADGKAIHVVWMDDWYPGALTYVRAVHSADGGKTFSTPVAASDAHGVDGANVAVDGAGNIVAFWHDLSHNQTDGQKVDKPANSSEATWLYFTESTDGGASFKFPSTRVQADGKPPAACSMCMTSTATSADGSSVSVVFRSALNDIRDFYEISATAPARARNAWTSSRVNADNFYQTTCPMNGPTVSAGSKGQARVAAFTTGGTVAGKGFDDFAYWALSSPAAGGAWTEHVPTPDHVRSERYPTAAIGGLRQDAVLMTWQVGPMAVSGTASVKYSLFHINGTAWRTSKGSVVELGTGFAGTKPTVWSAQNGT
jgi:hypothetical protein